MTRRSLAVIGIAGFAVVGVPACSDSDSDDDRDRVTRIDGPAVVDRDDSGVTQSRNDDE